MVVLHINEEHDQQSHQIQTVLHRIYPENIYTAMNPKWRVHALEKPVEIGVLDGELNDEDPAVPWPDRGLPTGRVWFASGLSDRPDVLSSLSNVYPCLVLNSISPEEPQNDLLFGHLCPIDLR